MMPDELPDSVDLGRSPADEVIRNVPSFGVAEGASATEEGVASPRYAPPSPPAFGDAPSADATEDGIARTRQAPARLTAERGPYV